MISDEQILLRLGLSVLLALALGIEREFKQQPAGIRTHILISVGSCLLMILSILVPEIYHSTNNDPARIAAQVVSGIGFLGAGAIIRNGLTTKGLTTAANIWATAAIGLAVGAGLYFVSIVTTILVLLNLIVFTKFKTRFFPPTRYCSITLSFSKKLPLPNDIMGTLKKLPIEIVSESIKDTTKTYQIQLITRLMRNVSLSDLQHQIDVSLPHEGLSLSENIKS